MVASHPLPPPCLSVDCMLRWYGFPYLQSPWWLVLRSYPRVSLWPSRPLVLLPSNACVRSSVGGALVCYAEGPEFEPQHWEKQVWWWTPAVPALRQEMEVGGTKLQGRPHSKFKACTGSKRPCLRKEKKCACICPQVHTHRETHVDTDPDSCLEQAMCSLSLHQQAYPGPQTLSTHCVAIPHSPQRLFSLPSGPCGSIIRRPALQTTLSSTAP